MKEKIEIIISEGVPRDMRQDILNGIYWEVQKYLNKVHGEENMIKVMAVRPEAQRNNKAV